MKKRKKHIGGPSFQIYRKFNGRRFKFKKGFEFKRDAKKYVEKLNKNYRIVSGSSRFGKHYLVYTRG